MPRARRDAGFGAVAQIGEFGILACSLAYKMKVIDHDLFKTGIAITALSLLLSTIWIMALRKFAFKNVQASREKTVDRDAMNFEKG